MPDLHKYPRQAEECQAVHSGVKPRQYEVLQRYTPPLAPPLRTRRQQSQTQKYQEQSLSHYIPAVRTNFAYRPPLDGKAAEFFGVEDVSQFENDISFGRMSTKRPKCREEKCVKKAQARLPPTKAGGPLVSRFSWESEERLKQLNKKRRAIGCAIM